MTGAETSSRAFILSLPRSVIVREGILEALATGPKTDEQLAQLLEIDGSSERPRRRELERKGLVVNSGEVALTSSGRAAVLWARNSR